MTPIIDNYITVKEAMHELRVCRTKLYAIVKRGYLKKYKLGGTTLFLKEEISNLIKVK